MTEAEAVTKIFNALSRKNALEAVIAASKIGSHFKVQEVEEALGMKRVISKYAEVDGKHSRISPSFRPLENLFIKVLEPSGIVTSMRGELYRLNRERVVTAISMFMLSLVDEVK